MVKSLKFLRHRRTDAGYFSEFLIAKTPGDLENREPKPQPQQQQQQMSLPHAAAATVIFAGPPAIAAAPAPVSLFIQSEPSAAYVTLPFPAAVAMREEVVVAAPSNSAPPPPAPAARTAPARSQDPLRLARRRERNRTAAAKCRQRRQDQLELLADCVRELESANGDLEAEVAELAASRAQLESTIRHLAQCDEDGGAAAASVWLTQPTMAPVAAPARPTSLSLSGESLSDELPSLTTPRGFVGSGLTPLLMTPQSAFKLESMLA